MPNMKPPQLITVSDGAARAGVSPVTLRRWIADGFLPAYRLGPRSIRIDPRDLDGVCRPLEVNETPKAQS